MCFWGFGGIASHIHLSKITALGDIGNVLDCSGVAILWNEGL